MNITRGKIPSAQKVVIYGPEGIGKSTFASKFPEPLFLDTEGSTKHMDVARMDPPSSWSMLMQELEEVKKEGKEICKTLVLDTADWAEQLCAHHICSKAQKSGIEDFGYGKGYVYLKEEFGRLLNRLDDIIQEGIHVVLVAHAKMRKFEQPEEMGAYDRWELKLDKNVAPLVKEWADMVLFANYKVFTVRDEQTGRNKAQGGKRVMYTSHHPCWDAKNRCGLPPEINLDFSGLAPYFEIVSPKSTFDSDQSKELKTIQTITAEDDLSFDSAIPAPSSSPAPESLDGIPDTLAELMRSKEVSLSEIQQVVFQKGHFPQNMPVRDYPKEYIEGVLIGAWPQVWAAIEQNRKDDVPF